jgi:hypothetical protein
MIFTSSILIGSILAILKFGEIRSIYYPFIYLLWIGSINEIISYILMVHGHYNIINGIIYDLTESILLLWFLKNLGVFFKRRYLFYLFITVFVLVWIIESFFKNRFSNFNSYFNITYSFSIVILTINALNIILFKERQIIKNPAFLICIGIIIFFTYKIMVEVFWLSGLEENGSFSTNVYYILTFINLICNLIYALAVLWMRKKQAFTLQF